MAYGLPDLTGDGGIAGYGAAALLLVLATIWATLPFVVVAVAVLEGHLGRAGTAAATCLSIIALVLVPPAVDRSIENDPSSTAGLIHIWDPVLMSLAPACVIGVSWLRARRRPPR